MSERKYVMEENRDFKDYNCESEKELLEKKEKQEREESYKSFRVLVVYLIVILAIAFGSEYHSSQNESDFMKKLNSAELYKKSEYFKTHPMGLEKFFVNNIDENMIGKRTNYEHINSFNDYRYFIARYENEDMQPDNVIVNTNKARVIISIGDGSVKSEKLDVGVLAESHNSDYKQMLLSYRRDKVAFLFERNEGEVAVKHELIVVDLESGNAVELVSELGESFVPFDFKILNFKWLENDEIEITIPNKDQVGSQSIVEWFKGENSDTAVMRLRLE
jgi:hypothetical protein